MILFPKALIKSKSINIKYQIAIGSINGFEDEGNFHHESGDRSRTQ